MPDQSDVTADGGAHGRDPRPGRPADTRPADPRPADREAADPRPADRGAGDRRPADRRPPGDVEPTADVVAEAVGDAAPEASTAAPAVVEEVAATIGATGSPGPAGAPRGPTGRGLANPWVVLAVTTLSVFAVFLDTTILFVAFPDLVATFPDVSRSSLSWVLNAYTIVFAAGLVPAGRIADRVGRRRCFLIAVAVFTLASALCGIAPSPELLVAARVLQALGAALMVPSSLALVLQTFPTARVPVALAVWGAVGAVAGAVGPSLGALVIDGSGWRWAFYLNVPVGIVALAAGLRVLPEGRESRPGPIPDPVGALVLVAGMALLALGVVQADAWGFGSSSTLGAVAAGAALLALFVWRCSRVAAPVFDLTLFRTWNYRWANAATATFYVGFTASFFANFQFLESVWGYSLLTAGLAMTPGPLVVAVLAPFMGRIAAARGQRRLLVPGGLVTAAGALWLLTAAGGEAHWLAHWLPGSILTGVGVALCLPQLSSAALQGLPADRFGSGSAGNQAIRNLASTLAVSLAVTLVGVPLTQGEAIAGFQRVWWVAVASGLATSLLSLPLRRSTPHPSAAGLRTAAPTTVTPVAGGDAAPVPAAVTARAPAADGVDAASSDRQVTVAD